LKSSTSSGRGAVGEVLPEAIIVFDRFHVKARLNKAVDKVQHLSLSE
jgi:transposase